MSQYIIAGGASGKERLALLGRILNGGTLDLLRRLEPGPVDRFLDLGCGGGSVSVAAAKTGYAQQVTGIDFDEKLIELARKDAADVDVRNVTFTQGDATTFDAVDTYDVAYARFLFSHMTDTGAVLRNLARATRPGGLVLLEDVDFAGHFCYPASAAFDRYVDWYERAARHNGQDPHVGRRLFELLGSAGLQEAGFDLVQPVFHKGEGKWMAVYTLEKIGPALLQQGLATEEEWQATVDELKAFTADQRTIISMPRIFRAWARLR
ncbi:MAG: methyltransferase domain-containing protein [Chitinophagaceae bacterium]|nr:MAG: methyltransferase domain-containing protein [Chitinophagaceae bacterium]